MLAETPDHSICWVAKILIGMCCCVKLLSGEGYHLCHLSGHSALQKVRP